MIIGAALGEQGCQLSLCDVGRHEHRRCDDRAAGIGRAARCINGTLCMEEADHGISGGSGLHFSALMNEFLAQPRCDPLHHLDE